MYLYEIINVSKERFTTENVDPSSQTTVFTFKRDSWRLIFVITYCVRSDERSKSITYLRLVLSIVVPKSNEPFDFCDKDLNLS